jgi:hypothetical protein
LETLDVWNIAKTPEISNCFLGLVYGVAAAKIRPAPSL